MRLVHAHFPIQGIISKNKRLIEVKNFLGGKKAHAVPMQDGVTVETSKDTQHEIIIDGNDIAKVSLSCSQISGVCKCGRKDKRKFLDGVYVSEKTLIDPKLD